METWQNIKGNPIPDFLQGRGTGESGRNLCVIIDDSHNVVIVKPNQYVTKLSSGEIVITNTNLEKL